MNGLKKYNYSSDIGRLLLASENYGMFVDTGILLSSNTNHVYIYWFRTKRREYLSQHLFKASFEEGLLCFA